MKCDRIRELFADEWAGDFDAGANSQVEAHLAQCASCREEHQELARLWNQLGQLPLQVPSPEMRSRFHAMLEGYQQGLGQNRLRGRSWSFLAGWNPFRPVFQAGLAALLLVLGFASGYFLRATRNGGDDMANLRAEVHDMRRMVTLSLLKQQSASERLKGVSWSNTIRHPDPEFLDTLLHTLDLDPSVDVRLSAVDALSRFAGDPSVRRGLLQSLKKQDSPMVQISLIDLLVQLHERESVEVLKELTNDSRQNEAVRQRAQWGLQVLS
jgi:hypothetical protein